MLAVVCHLGFGGLLLFLSHVHVNFPGGGRAALRSPRAVTLRGVSSQQWAKNRGEVKGQTRETARLERTEAAPKEPEKRKPEARPQGQVVDVAPGNNQEAPDAKYLAESANKVSKETHAKDQTAFYRNAMPQRTATHAQQGNGSAEKAQLAGNNGLGTDDRPLREGGQQKAIMEVPDVKRRSEVALRDPNPGIGPGALVPNRSESAEVTGNSNRLKIQQGDAATAGEDSSSGRQGQPGAANLTPSMAVIDKITGAAPNDHLADVDEGEGTFLNTKEWKFASFFNRVKQSVGMHWDPATNLRQRDPSGSIYGGRDRYTVVNVTLTDRGTVKDIYVEKSCGVDFLDLEAIHSFERAQPFPNPPPGLVTADSTVRFSFGFFLEMGSGARLRLFRQSN